MCQACWVDEFGRSTDLPENAEEIADLIRELYSQPKCSTGGPLHAEIDDMNIEDEWDVRVPENEPDYFSPGTVQTAQRICDLMNALPVPQRAAVIALWEGWL